MIDDLENKIKELVKENETPFYVFDSAQIVNKYKFISKNLNQAKLYYALKANSEIEVLKILNELDANFEIASKEELAKLIDLKVSPKRIVFGNPVKKKEDIKFALDYGVNYFVFDCSDEFNKIKDIVESPELILRINVSDLSKNIDIDFGATIEDIKKMHKEIKDFSSQVKGLTFYGDVKPAIEKCLQIRQEFFPKIDLINIGGGFQDNDKYVDYKYFIEINQLMKTVSEEQGIRFYVEPGLYIVNSSGYLVSKVIASGYRNNKNVVYLDAGIPTGLIGDEFEDKHIPLTRISEKNLDKVIFYGPTCDNFDLFIRENIVLPQMDDIIYFKNIGAYSICYANNFHAFARPKIIYI